MTNNETGTRADGVISTSLEQDLTELFVLVERRADRRPLPLRALPLVVVHAVEVRAPARARFRRHVLQRTQERVRHEDFGAPAGDRRVRLLRSARDARR